MSKVTNQEISASSSILVDDDEDDSPLPLISLRDRVSSKTFLWLQNHENEEKQWIEQNELESETSANIIKLFSRHDSDIALNDDNIKNDHDDDESAYCRVQEWCSSEVCPDGIGGYCIGNGDEDEDDEEEESSKYAIVSKYEEQEGSFLRIKYILSDSAGGHGDDLWAASRHISNLFANQDKCLDLLSPLFESLDDNAQQVASFDQHHDDQHRRHHPLLGLDFIELGAGAGLPSWTAMRCGARVVCTDQAIPNRIRCMAESAERNIRYMMKIVLRGGRGGGGPLKGKDDQQEIAYQFAVNARVCPYSWGDPIDEIVELRSPPQSPCQNHKKFERFDIVLAADCIYMPLYHESLLDSIGMLMSNKGIALLPFALHGNVNDEEVWNILNVAADKGFNVEVLESCQLCPQALNMDSKRGLIHVLRLTRKSYEI